jgi:hypothetical protein
MAGLTITTAGTYDGAGATVDSIIADTITGKITIKNYVVSGGTQNGIKLLDCSDVDIINNLIINNAWNGIYSSNSVTDNLLYIAQNDICSNGWDGVYINKSYSSARFRNNIFFPGNDAPWAAVYANDGNAALSNNCFYGWEYVYWSLGELQPDPEYNTYADPLFVSSPTYAGSLFPNGYFLSQIMAGEAVDSPCVDAGYGTAYPGFTRTDSVDDSGTADIGFHYNLITGSVQCRFGPLINFAGARVKRLVPIVA